MTFAQQLKEEYKQEFMGTIAQKIEQQGLQRGLQQGRQEGHQEGLQEGLHKGEYRKALLIAKNLLKKNIPLSVIKSATGLSDQELALEEDVEEKV